MKALLSSVLLALTLQPAARPDQSVLIEIPATSPWTDTGIVLNAGDRIEIRACPLLALSRHRLLPLHRSAFRGKRHNKVY